ncbi:BTAD domain-containing putative transcriptional regulator [Lachnospiraceae bacterium 62-35]
MKCNNIITACMFGNLSISHKDMPVTLKCTMESRYMQLFLMLLYYNKKGITKKNLIESLYEEKVGAVDNALRIVVHRLRKLIKESELPDGEYVVVEGDRYYLTKSIRIELDTDHFIQAVKKAAKEENKEKEAGFLREACRIYQGDFLREYQGEIWVEIENGRFQKIYSEVSRRLADKLWCFKEYGELEELAEKNSRIFPFEDWQFVRIEAFLAEGRKKEAAHIYEETLKMFQEEFGVGIPDDTIRKFEDVGNRIFEGQDPKELIESAIKKDVNEGGAYYCSYLSFMDCCHVMKRIAERNRYVLTMLVCYVVERDKDSTAQDIYEKGEESSYLLRQAIHCSLRKEDLYTKYGAGTFMILMVGITEDDDFLKVFQRIEKHFNRIKNNRKLKIQYKVYPINW